MSESSVNRRRVLLWAAMVGGGLAGRDVAARAADEVSDEPAFDAVSMRDALVALGGIPAHGDEIVLTMPDVVENGAVVPVTVDCRLRDVREVYIVVEANPNPLVARFTIPPGTEAFVSTRIKMAGSSAVYAVVRADGRLYSTSRQTQVMVGGCG